MTPQWLSDLVSEHFKISILLVVDDHLNRKQVSWLPQPTQLRRKKTIAKRKKKGKISPCSGGSARHIAPNYATVISTSPDTHHGRMGKESDHRYSALGIREFDDRLKSLIHASTTLALHIEWSSRKHGTCHLSVQAHYATTRSLMQPPASAAQLPQSQQPTSAFTLIGHPVRSQSQRV
jgi:hypothetical protein